MALDDIKGMIGSGDYQGAYDAARMQGYDPTQIADWLKTNYNTNWTGDTLSSAMESTSQQNLANQGYSYATYMDNGSGAGKPLQIGSSYLGGTITDPNTPEPIFTAGMAVPGPVSISGSTGSSSGASNNRGAIANPNTPAPIFTVGMEAPDLGPSISGPGLHGFGGERSQQPAFAQSTDTTSGIKNYKPTTINPTSPITAAQAGYQGYDPSLTQVNKDTDTVAGQLSGLINDQNSVLNAQARTYGMQQANERGLLNSSMAVGASQDAVYKNAIPIAAQDASTYTQARLANQAAQNAAGAFKAGAFNNAEQFNANSKNATEQFNANLANNQAQFNAETINQAGQRFVDTFNQAFLAGKNMDYNAWALQQQIAATGSNLDKQLTAAQQAAQAAGDNQFRQTLLNFANNAQNAVNSIMTDNSGRYTDQLVTDASGNILTFKDANGNSYQLTDRQLAVINSQDSYAGMYESFGRVYSIPGMSQLFPSSAGGSFSWAKAPTATTTTNGGSTTSGGAVQSPSPTATTTTPVKNFGGSDQG